MTLAKPIIAFVVYGAFLGMYFGGLLPETLTAHPIIIQLLLVLTTLGALYGIFAPMLDRGNWG